MTTTAIATPTTSQLTTATQTARRTARMGLKAEDNVREYLRSIGHLTVDSTRYENMVLDIDCRHAVTHHAISIKMQNKAVHTGRLCFETKRFNMQQVFADCGLRSYPVDDPLYGIVERNILQPEYTKYWEPSWYEQGKADWYVIGVDEALYKLKVPTLHDYVAQVGWQDYKTTVSPTIRLQHYGRKYTDYQVGLLQITELLHNNVMTHLR